MIKGLLRCFVYLALVGIASFILGRILPKKWFNSDAFPYKSFKFENEGKIYNKFHIRNWQKKLPDMSRLFPKLMPEKKFADRERDVEKLPLMIQETCVAEFIHWLLFILGFGCVFLWKGAWGWIVAVVYNLVGNVPFIIIQRYNRPRLKKTLKMAERI